MSGEDIVVVEAGGAAVFHQLAHTRQGGQADNIAVQILPDLIQGFQPVKQLHILHLGQVAGEHLIEMVVGVYQTGIAKHVGAIDDSVSGGIQIGADFLDEAILAQHIHIGQHSVTVVTGDKLGNVFDQQGRHSLSSFIS